MWNKKLKTKLAAAAATVAMTVTLLGSTAFAATGIVNATDVNVRSSADTSSDIVGTATVGETYDLGESATDADGNTWYQITLSDGTTGYIRSDFLDISEDSSTDSSTATTETTESATTESTDTATTDTTSTDTGDYQIVLAPDDTGTDTYYLYNNAEGTRMKLSDIDTMQTELETAQSELSSVKTRYRIFLIVLAILFIIALIACIMLYMRLREALRGPQRGNRERDLTRDRNVERRNNPHSDDLNLRSTRGGRESGAPQRPVNGAQRRPVNGQPTRRPVNGQGQPVRRPMNTQGQANGQPVRRPMNGQQTSRPVNAQGQQVRRPVQQDQNAQAQATTTQRPVRPAQGQQTTARPTAAANNAARRPVQQNTQKRPQTRPASDDEMDDDDEFDSNFIVLDDKDE